MRAETAFIEDMDELTRLVGAPTPFGMRNISAILRRHLCDDRPLYQAVARGRDFKPFFEILGTPHNDDFRKAKADRPGFLYDVVVEMDPSVGGHLPGIATRKLNLQEFLAYPVSVVGGSIVTVKELIRYVANNAGGVHWSEPNQKFNSRVIHEKLSLSVQINGQPYPMTAMLSIARVTLTAMKPLYMIVRY